MLPLSFLPRAGGEGRPLTLPETARYPQITFVGPKAARRELMVRTPLNKGFPVARFRYLSITTFNDSGIPSLELAENQWINLDQVTSVEGLVRDTDSHGGGPSEAIPFLVLSVASGRQLIAPLGCYDSRATAAAVLADTLTELLGAQPRISPAPIQLAKPYLYIEVRPKRHRRCAIGATRPICEEF